MTQFTKDQLDTFTARIRHIEFGMFTSSNDAHALSSRPLTVLKIDEQGRMWFCASDQQSFTAELANNAQVNVSFADVKDNLYVSVSGRAELLRDRKKAQQLWDPMVKSWLPGGLDDPHLALIKVTIESAEYWDSHSSTMTHFFAKAKEALTGERPRDTSEHGKIDL